MKRKSERACLMAGKIGFFFAHKVGRVLHVSSQTENEGRTRTYRIVGQVFFASAERFVAAFDFKEVIDGVRIDLSRAHFWDITAVSALDKVKITHASSSKKIQRLLKKLKQRFAKN